LQVVEQIMVNQLELVVDMVVVVVLVHLLFKQEQLIQVVEEVVKELVDLVVLE
jgi:hypothetical protein